MVQYSPVADPSVLVTVTIIVIDDGLLRTSTGCAGPAFSITRYIVSLNITVMARKQMIAYPYVPGNYKMVYSD